MTSKSAPHSVDVKPTVLAAARPLGIHAKAVPISPVVEVFFAVEPLVAIVQRHVKISKKARDAITRDLTEALNQSNAFELTAIKASTGQQTLESDPVLTTQEAARLVGVSRPFMAKLIDSGAVELDLKVGNQRRVRRSAVTHWQSAERARQALSLKRLAKDLDEEIFSF